MKKSSFPAWCSKVEKVLDTAFKEKRQLLFEHEVYEILEYMGVMTPTYFAAQHEKNINRQVLSLFGSDKIVLKVISPAVAHKQKIGGVKVVHKDLEFVKYSFNQMIESFKKRDIPVAGVLLVEYINYTQDLGNEILLGLRESDAFGPVISFSKGGSDAVHFASHFSSPNLILPPVSREWATAFLSSIKIQKKFLEEGKSHYISHITESVLKFSDLATAFSNFFVSETGYVLKEFEINPFVFDTEGTFIAIDGYATFEKKSKQTISSSIQPPKTLKPFFEPNNVAIVGISTTDNNKPGNIIIKNLLDLQRNDVFGVNRKGGNAVIQGKSFPLYQSILDIPRQIDCAIITVPATATLPVVKECAEKGVKAIILIPGGFSEATKDKNLETEILDICTKHSIRIIGPNCLGIIYAGDTENRGINTFFIPEEKFKVNMEKEKNVCILSQSGAMGIMEIYNLRDSISPKVIVSYGNQLDVDPADLAQYFEDDQSIDVIGLYIEGFKPGAGRTFFDITSKSKKPIIVYKAGRTEAGRRATESHTASIAGEYEVARAAMKQAGLIVADSMIYHGDFIKTFALLHDFEVKGNKVAVIANAGYEKTYAADNLGNLALTELSDDTKKQLRDILPPFVTIETLLDLTPMVSDEQFTQCIEILLQASEVDALCISIVPHAQVIHTTDKEIDAYKENIASGIVHMVHKYKKPVVVSVNVVSGVDAVYNKFGLVMDSGGVPTFLTAGRAMNCLNAFVRYKLIKEKNIINEWLV